MKKITIFVLSVGFFSSVHFSFAANNFNRDLYFGMKNDSEVRNLQQFLTEQGIYSGPVTGNFYSLTLAAVKEFQKLNNVSPVSGYFGFKTRAKANEKMSAVFLTPVQIQNKIAELIRQIENLRQQLAVAQQEESQLSATTTEMATTTPVVSVPAVSAPSNPFNSTLRVGSTLPSRTLSSYGEQIISEFKFLADEKIAITRLRLKNSGTFPDEKLVLLKLVDSKTETVLANVDNPTNGYIEFNMTADETKVDKGLVASGGTYYIRAIIITPNYGEIKPKIQLNIEAVSDISAFDYNDLTRVAKISTSTNIFPIEGAFITVF